MLEHITIDRIREADQSALENTRAALARAEALGGKNALNCVAEIDPSAARQSQALDAQKDAKALPLFGIPVLVKDNIDVSGLRTTAGSLALADNVAEADAPIVRNLRKNGAVIIGKTNMTEFANFTTQGMPGGYSSYGGQVIHAICPDMNPGGSSSGSAVAVCAGIVPVAVGTDTSHSITACAQINGICGLKPPAGTLPASGIVPISRTLDSAGAMAYCFKDALRLYSAMRDQPLPELDAAPLSGMKIAVNTANSDTVSQGQNDFLRTTLSSLTRSGAEISEIHQPANAHLPVIMQWEFPSHLADYLRASRAAFKTLREIVAFYEAYPDTMMRYGISRLRASLDETPGGLGGQPYLDALKDRLETVSALKNELSNFDAVIVTGPTNIMHYCGFPSVTIAGSARNDSGVPRGLILYGSDELRLYRAALAVEKMLRQYEYST